MHLLPSTNRAPQIAALAVVASVLLGSTAQGSPQTGRPTSGAIDKGTWGAVATTPAVIRERLGGKMVCVPQAQNIKPLYHLKVWVPEHVDEGLKTPARFAASTAYKVGATGSLLVIQSKHLRGRTPYSSLNRVVGEGYLVASLKTGMLFAYDRRGRVDFVAIGSGIDANAFRALLKRIQLR